MNPEVTIDAPAALALTFRARFEAEVKAAIAARGSFSWALTGGSVAEAFYPVLADSPLPWDRIDFFWGDERAVGPDDPDSNYALANELLLQPVRAPAARVHRMRGEEPDLDAAARAYEGEMAGVLGPSLALDLVVLGVGPEGHVCSLFPGHPLLRERSRRVAAILDSPKPPPRRLTFTPPVLEAARMVCVAGFGDSKAAAIAEALDVPDSQLPVALALRAAPRALVLVDPAAAKGIHHR